MGSSTASNATVVGTGASAYNRNTDLHASLMDEIRSPRQLKDVRAMRAAAAAALRAAWLN